MTDPLQEQRTAGDEEFEDQPLEAAAEAEDAELPQGEDEDQDDAAADAAASPGGDATPVAARKSAASTASAKVLALDPQARDGLIRCLQARILELDATLAHATMVAQKDTFYSRWPNVVTELRSQALKRLEELQRS